VQQRGKAQPGGKTVVDALAPAVEAATAAAEQNHPLETVLQRAAEGARAGAEATRDMVARYGRARFLGERSLGHQDAGATSMAIMLTAWAEVLAET
jgi:dihydroxyacetone kinase